MQRGVAYKKLNQQVSIKHALHGQKSTKQRSGQTIYLSNKHQKIDIPSYDLCLRFWSPSAFGGYFVQIAVLWGHAGSVSVVRSREVSAIRRF